jgi:hypothetical protein
VVAGVVLAGMAMPAVVGIGALSGQIGATAMDTVENADAGRIDAASMPLVTTVLDRNGGPLATLYDQYRLPVTYGPDRAQHCWPRSWRSRTGGFFTDSGLDRRRSRGRWCTTPAAAGRPGRRSDVPAVRERST